MGLRQRSSTGLRESLTRFKKQSEKQIQNAVVDYGEDKAAYFRKVTANWQAKPKFVVKSLVRKATYTVSVVPSGEHGDKFMWVDIGTGRYGPKKQSYIIRPKTATALRFQTGYNPRTAPIARYNVGDGGRSGDWVTKQEVEHPGIKSREFNKTFDEDSAETFIQSIHQAVRKGINAG